MGARVSYMARSITALALMLVTMGGAGCAQAAARKLAELPVPEGIAALAFSPDGRYLAGRAPITPDVSVWEWRTGRLVRTLTPEGGMGVLQEMALRFSPDGRQLALLHDVQMGSSDRNRSSRGVVHVWNAQSGELIRILDGGGMTGLEFSPDGGWLLRLFGRSTETPGDQLVVYSCADWQVAWGLRVLPFYPEKLVLSPDGRFAALGGLEAGPNVAVHSPIWIVDLQKHAIVRKINAFPADSTLVDLSWSPAGDRIVAGANVFNLYPGVETLKVFAVPTGKQVAGVQAPDQLMTAIQYACAGKCVIEAGFTSGVIIWDASLRRVLQKIPASWGAVAVSPGMRFLALPVGSKSGSKMGSRLEVWQLE